MAQNTSPIFLGVPKLGFASTGTSANTALDGTGTVVTLFTADATDGSKIEKIKLKHLGTNIATVVRFFINNGSTNVTAANNALYKEVAMAANTLDQTAESVEVLVQVDLVLPAGYKLNCTLGTAIASGIMVTAVGGDY